MSRLQAVVFATLVSLSACGSETGARGPVQVAVRDSAGISIREYTAEMLASAPTFVLDSTPLTTVRGSADDEANDISTFSLVTFLGSGHLIGVDRLARQVVVIPADGAAPWRIGRRGSGPGEFQFIGDVAGLAGDSILIVDGQSARLAVSDLRGVQIRLVPLTALFRHRAYGVTGRLGGRWVGYGFTLTDEADTMAESRLISAAMTDRGDSAMPLFRSHPSTEAERRIASDNRVMAVPRPGRFTGFPTLLIAGDHLVHADGNAGEVTLRDANGTIRQLHRLRWPRAMVSAALWEQFVADHAARMFGDFGQAGDAEFDERRREFLAAGHPDSFPKMAQPRATPGGTLWIERYRIPGDSTWEAVAIATNGSLLGRLVGTGAPPTVYGDDRVAFRVEDDDGIATIRILVVRRP